jgi:hypothetical protein
LPKTIGEASGSRPLTVLYESGFARPRGRRFRAVDVVFFFFLADGFFSTLSIESPGRASYKSTREGIKVEGQIVHHGGVINAHTGMITLVVFQFEVRRVHKEAARLSEIG